MFSPLEQFDVIQLGHINLYIYDLHFLNILLPLIFLNILFFFLKNYLEKNVTLVPNVFQNCIEILYNFVLNLLWQQVGSRGIIYFPLLFTLSNFTLFCNLFSLLPHGIAITSHLVLILYLSLTIGLSIFSIGLLKYNLKFLKIFIPQCPFILMPILIPIEIFSYVIRMFSLAIRLAANILAGHTLVSIISSSTLGVAKKNIFFFLFLILLYH